jgi:CheY-like chemotaxis protein
MEASMAKVLVVEDEAVVAVHVCMILQGAGHQTTDVVADGSAALASVARERPDVVLMDMTIQGSLDGVATARLLRQQYPQVKVVFVTAHSDEASRLRAAELRPEGFLLKPFHDVQLRNMVETALAQSVHGSSSGLDE